MQKYLQENWVQIDDVIYIDFSELDNKNTDLIALYQSYTGRKPFFILDEIQELDNFESQVLFLYNEWCQIFLSGSNSHLLGQDIATRLRGRTYEILNDVLSFDEYLIFREKDTVSLTEKDILFDEYLMWWGYPEVVLQDSPIAKKSLLQSYLDVTIYRDLIDRYRIRNPEILASLIRSLCISHTKPLNINKLYNTYKSLGYSVSKNTLYEYLWYLKNVFLIETCQNLYKKTYFEKVYLLDNGYMNLYSEEQNMWQKFENIIYKFLRKSGKKIGFVDTPSDVDFSDGDRLIQVTYELTEENLSRETQFAKASGKKELIVRKRSQLQPPASILQKWYEEFLWEGRGF